MQQALGVFSQVLRLYHTLKYLKAIQIYYRLYYVVRSRFHRIRGFTYTQTIPATAYSLTLLPSINPEVSLQGDRATFLNRTHHFKGTVDWSCAIHGKLWTYNITYFDFLHQQNMTSEIGLDLIRNFIENSAYIKDGMEPFPISLRGINWIKFLSYHHIEDQQISDSLYAQYRILLDNIEYHLLGNHLLENGFSLLFGAYYFRDEQLFQKAQEILTAELHEQILDDGAHFELSPMYHQIMLFRLLDCINLLQNNLQERHHSLLELLQQKASMMLGWLQAITYKDGSIPLFNDSANHIAPTSRELFGYTKRLNLHVKETILKESGYRKFENDMYECIVDVGSIGPDYIPGHAHADTFSFELHVNGKPFIVDTGLSTYETNKRRTRERATISHNTVELNGLNQSDVWGGFRVAHRAYVTTLQEDDTYIKAVHNGYEKTLGALHEREFVFETNMLKIIDTIISDRAQQAIARIHFHPSVNEAMIRKHILIEDEVYHINEYQYAPEFNVHVNAKVLEVAFTQKLEMSIIL